MIKTIRLKDKKEGHKEYPIRLSTGAFTIFEQITGLPSFETLGDGELLKKTTNMQALIYGGIKMAYMWNEEEFPLTFEGVGNIMDLRLMPEYIKTALASMPIDESLEEKKSLILEKVS